MRKSTANNIFIGAICFVAGSLLGFFYLVVLAIMNGVGFKEDISVSINPIDPISIATTLLLAIFIATRLTPNSEAKRIEKDLLISDLKDFKVELRGMLKTILLSSSVNIYEIAADMKSTRMALNTLILLIRDYGHSNECPALEKLDPRIRDINDLLSDTGDVSADGTIFKDDAVMLSSSRKHLLRVAQEDVNKMIFETVCAINLS